MSKNECKRCSECKHYRPIEAQAAEDMGDCTLYPEWIEVFPYHYCGQWTTANFTSEEIHALDIDWSQVPDGYDWVAQDEDGDIFAFDIEPISAVSLEWLSKTKNYYLVSHGEFYNPDWRNTLTKRPIATNAGK